MRFRQIAAQVLPFLSGTGFGLWATDAMGMWLWPVVITGVIAAASVILLTKKHDQSSVAK